MHEGIRNLGLSAVNIFEPFHILGRDLWQGAKEVVGDVRDKALSVLSFGIFGKGDLVANTRSNLIPFVRR